MEKSLPNIKYLFQFRGDAIFIWTKQYQEDHGHVSDMGTRFVKWSEDDEPIFDSSFDEIEDELSALGFEEACESLWIISDYYFSMEDPKRDEFDEILKYLNDHPRFIEHKD